jgi:hypothetical protein
MGRQAGRVSQRSGSAKDRTLRQGPVRDANPTRVERAWCQVTIRELPQSTACRPRAQGRRYRSQNRRRAGVADVARARRSGGSSAWLRCSWMNLARPTQRVRFFVGGLGLDATEGQIHTAFAGVGVTLRHVHIVMNRATGCSRGFAFVSVDSPPFGPGSMPKDLLQQMGGVTVNDRASSVCFVAGPYAPSLQWSPSAPSSR